MKHFCSTLILVLLTMGLYAQPPAENSRIEILGGQNMRMFQIDSATTLTSIAIGAIVRQGSTTIYGDSIVVNPKTNIAEIFGHVHINDGDSVHTYADYLRYTGNNKMAYLKRNVRLTDGKGTLFANEVTYNVETGIANYMSNGRVVHGKTVLTSTNANYISDTKDVFFKKNVHLKDPKYDIVADSLRYNTQSGIAYFIAPTVIKTAEGGTILTRNGIYNLNTGQAEFYDQTSLENKDYYVKGDKISYEDKDGVMVVEGNVKIIDSVNKVAVLGGYAVLDQKKKSILATRKSVMILYRDNDSTYITADTLFSGLNVTDKVVNKKDTIKGTTKVNLNAGKDSIRYFLAFRHVRIFNDSLQAVSDSLHYSTFDSTFRLFKDPVVWNGKNQVTGDTMYLYTANQKPQRLYVFNNSIVINKDNEEIYNQIGGRTLNAFFKDGAIDYVRVKGGPAESIYYPLDDDSAYVGMNRSKSDVIDITFLNKELNRVKFISTVDGTLYPMNQIPDDQKRLKNFEWLNDRRPKNKMELFE